MNANVNDRRMVWLLAGVLVGLGLASFWPAENVQALATDRSDRFAITTVNVGPGMPDAVFVLDFLTGRLTGGLVNPQSGRFTNFYFRNIASDFLTGDRGAGKGLKYAMIPGVGLLTTGGGVSSATGVLYIGEMTSGKIVAYRFPYRNSNVPLPEPFPLEPFDAFPFREADK